MSGIVSVGCSATLMDGTEAMLREKAGFQTTFLKLKKYFPTFWGGQNCCLLIEALPWPPTPGPSGKSVDVRQCHRALH